MRQKNNKSREKKTEKIDLRLTKKEKKNLCNRAAELNVSMSEYIRILLLKKEIKVGKKTEYCRLVVLCQELVSYIAHRYSREEDQDLTERIERIWNLLMSF